MKDYTRLEDIRTEIDVIDRQVVKLIAERGRLVKEAAKFKKDTADVRAPARVEQVIGKVRMIADENGLDPAIAEEMYRVMIRRFVEDEAREFQRLVNGGSKR